MNNFKIRSKFKGKSLKQEYKAPFTPKNVVNLFLNYEFDRWSRDLNTDFIVKYCLFESVKLNKNPDPEKYKYSSYITRFDFR